MTFKRSFLLAFLAGVPALAASSEAAGPAQIRRAAAPAIAMLQRSARQFQKAQGCFSCHHSGLPLMALRAARERGLAVDEAAARDSAAKSLWVLLNRQSVDTAIQATYLIDPALGDGYALLAAADAGIAPNLATAIYAHRLANWQRPDGHWNTVDVRPPQSQSRVTATAVALRAVQLYLPPQLKSEGGKVVSRARRWLESAEPQSTEEHAFRLFGLAWAGARTPELAKMADALLALQRADGGWAQLPSRASDAYSTAESLVVLRQAGGLPASHAAWQRGLGYLLSTQEKDGTWHVGTRQLSPAPVSPPYFESGFPYGHDQFVSAAATSWAVRALAEALPAASGPARGPAAPGSFLGEVQPWMETALFGSAADLEKRLEAGLDPNSKTAAGTTLLMAAAANPEKVRLLLARGADARAQAKSGFTALMAASVWQGAASSAGQLLAKGAEVNPGKDVLFNASPLFLAAFAGDRETVALLRSRGGDVQRRMNMLGLFPTSPLFVAAFLGDSEMAADLLAGGANVQELDESQMTPLHWAVLGNHVPLARVLLAGGAQVNHADRFGYTPLLYSATVDFGGAEMVRTLLAAGADPRARSKEGRTALAQARRLGFPAIRAALEASGAAE